LIDAFSKASASFLIIINIVILLLTVANMKTSKTQQRFLTGMLVAQKSSMGFTATKNVTADTQNKQSYISVSR